MPESPSDRRPPWGAHLHPLVPALLVGLLAAGVYLGTLTSAHTYDSVAYSLDVERALVTGSPSKLVHRYHAAWNAVGLAAAVVGPGLRAEPLLAFQVSNAVFGGALAGLVAAWLHRRTRSVLLASGAALLAFNTAVWHHSTDGEPYALASLLMFGSFAVAPFDRNASRGPTRVLAAAALLGAAVAVHLATVVVAPVFAAFLLGSSPKRRDWLHAAGFLGLAGLLALVPYVLDWTLVRGVGVVQGFRDLVDSVLSPRPPHGSYFLVEPWSPALEYDAVIASFAPTAPGLQAVAVALTLLGAAGAVLGWRHGRRAPAVAFLAFLVQLAFFASYNIGSRKFVVLQASFLVAAGLLGWAEFVRRRPDLARFDAVWPALAIVLAVFNFQGVIAPALVASEHEPFRAAHAIGETVPPEDAVLLIGRDSRHELKVFVPYFARREVIILDFLVDGRGLGATESARRVTDRLRAVRERGGRVHASAEVLEDTGPRRAFLVRNGFDESWLTSLLPAAGGEPSVRVDDRPLLYPLAPVP